MRREFANNSEAIGEVVDEARRYDRQLDLMEQEDRKDGLKDIVILVGIIAVVLLLYVWFHFFIS